MLYDYTSTAKMIDLSSNYHSTNYHHHNHANSSFSSKFQIDFCCPFYFRSYPDFSFFSGSIEIFYPSEVYFAINVSSIRNSALKYHILISLAYRFIPSSI